MADSLSVDWLNENSYRAYPLKETIVRLSDTNLTLTNDVILDAQLIRTNPSDTLDLTQIIVDTINAQVVVNDVLSFTIPLNSSFPMYCRLPSGNLLVVGEGILKWPVGTHTFTSVAFEDSVITEFSAEWLGVQSLSCVPGAPLTGDINFLEGYQFEIGINNPVITLGANALYGKPLGCVHFGNASADCSSILSRINGAGPTAGKVLNFVAGPGVVIVDDPGNHRIFVGLSFDATDVCKPIVKTPI